MNTRVRSDERDQRWVTVYNDEAIKLMPNWTGGQSDPLYAISSSGGANYAWVFRDAIANLDADIAKVKKIGRNKYQLGKGTFTKAEIDELHIIHDALVMTLDDPESYGSPENEEALGSVVNDSSNRRLTYYVMPVTVHAGGRREVGQKAETITIDHADVAMFPHEILDASGIPYYGWDYTDPTGRWIQVPSNDFDAAVRTLQSYSPTAGLSESHHTVRDYIAVDPGGRVVAGPFKDYGTAKGHADRARGHVEFKMGERTGKVRSSSSKNRAR